MSATLAELRRSIRSAEDLHAVVRTMKAIAASSIAQYEQAVLSLDQYYATVRVGLGLCVREAGDFVPLAGRDRGAPAVLVLGSDQGLVGRFNDVVADRARALLPTGRAVIWVVGERAGELLADAGVRVQSRLAVPLSVHAIVPLVDKLLADYERGLSQGTLSELHLVYNRPDAGAVYHPVSERLLPLDETWRHAMLATPWPTTALPEVIGKTGGTLSGFLREFLFVSLFRACASSLASENASRLAAMQRADRNIGGLLEDLGTGFHRLRQAAIDEELFDVVAGYAAQPA